MKLFLVHCGYYDEAVSAGIFESHTNLFVAAESAEDARQRAKSSELFRTRRMHVDGIQRIDVVDGFRVALQLDESLNGATHTEAFQFRDLAPKAAAPQHTSA